MSSAQSPGTSSGRELRDNSSYLTVVRAQINFVVSTLSEENFDRNSNEIRSLCDQHGPEVEIHVIRSLIRVCGLDPAAPLPFRLLSQEVRRLARVPSKAGRFREAVERGEGDVFRVFDFSKFVNAVHLSALEKVILAAHVAASVSRSDLAIQGKAVFAADFNTAMVQLLQTPSFETADLSVEEAKALLIALLSESPQETPLLDPASRARLLSAMSLRYGMEIAKPLLVDVIPTMPLEANATLAGILISLSPDLTSDIDIMCALLSRFGVTDAMPLTEVQLIKVFSDLINAAADNLLNLDVSTFISALVTLSENLDWSKVMQSFDQPSRQLVDTATLKLVVAVLLSSPRNVMYPAVKGCWVIWSNALYQLRVLDALLSLPADTFSFVSLPGRRIITVDEMATAGATIKALTGNIQNHTWNSLDLVQLLIGLIDVDSLEVRLAVRELMDKAIKVGPELVEIALLKLPKPWSTSHADYVDKLLDVFLAGHPNHQLVLWRVFQSDEAYFMSSLRDFYQSTETNVTRILDIAQDLKILDRLLAVQPFPFALDLAALASRREYLNLEKWLADSYAVHGDSFTHAIMEFLDHKVKNDMSRDAGAEMRTLSLNAQTIAIFISFLRRSGANWTRADIEYFREIRNACLQLHPRLMSLAPGSDQEPGMTVVSFSPDTEAEAETIFKRMYEEEIPVDHVLHILQEFKSSTATRDHEVFACMLHTLFDEYKFFPVYPPRELAITAVLFGAIIDQNLVDHIPLGIAIRYVLDALRQPPDSNMFKFGVQALLRFRSRLGEWKELCHAVLALPHLQEHRPDIAEVARQALFQTDRTSNFDEVPSSDLEGVLDGSELANPPFHSINPDAISGDSGAIPIEETADQMLFIVNNLAMSNCEAKSSDMRDIFKDEYCRWFAHYLVNQRIGSELNNHQLYIKFLDLLGRSLLLKHVLNETLIKARTLMNSEATMHSAAERSILKNLGSWIGIMTLARDRPIKHRNLALKNLLLEGYDSSRLIVAIPFVCKILEQCAKSTIFHLPNPWLSGLVRLLAEFYFGADLILNLKFEIEVLCIALDIDLEKVEPTDLLRHRPILDLDAGPTEDFVGDIESLPMDGYGALGPMDTIHPTIPHLDGAPAQTALQAEGIMSSLEGAITLNTQLGGYAENEGFKRLVQVAIESAVREIIIPVVDRSVTIASISTQQLVLKDFAMEVDETRMRTAAHLTVRNLAGNLALVTCKEPLRINMVSHLRNILSEQGITEQMFSEQAILLLVQDNLNSACNVIERAAMDRAVADVDKALEPAYLARFRHREQRPGQPFWYSPDGAPPADYVLHNKWPDMLRLNPIGLSHAQMRVYDDFAASNRRLLSSVPAATYADQYQNQRASDESETLETSVETSMSFDSAAEKLTILLDDLVHFLSESSEADIRELGPSHRITLLIKELLQLPRKTEDQNRIGMMAAQRIAAELYKGAGDLSREVYVYLLQQLCHALPAVRKEVVEWLVLSDDERKLNLQVTMALLRVRLIDPHDLDAAIGRSIVHEFRPSFIDFATALVHETLTGDLAAGWRHQFPICYEALLRAASAGKATETAARLIKQLQGPEDKGPYNTLASYFKGWVRSFHQSTNLEQSFIDFVTHPEMQGILRGEDISSLFFRVCAEVSVERTSVALRAGLAANPYLYVDALSKLLAMIVKYHGEANNEHAKAHYLTKTLSIVVLVLAHVHEESDGQAFESRPFFRLFSSLLNDLQGIYTSASNTQFQLLLAMSDTFNTLQPAYFPGFAFGWMALISHRAFMARMLHAENREGWAPFHRLLISLLRFLGGFLRTGRLDKGSRELYWATLRILVVLLHDFPEFLSEYYFTICDHIPTNCVQLRNIILSAYPSNLVLPDPLGPRTLTMEHFGPIPPILSDFTSALKNGDLRGPLDQFLLNRGSTSFPSTVKSWIMASVGNDRYNLPVLNALVMYVGVSSVAQAKARNGQMGFIPTDPGVQLMQKLAAELDAEGQYHFLTALTTHLRYPNAHTHWFSSVVLHLFAEVESDTFQEITTRVLLEKFLVHKPHPWGAIATLVELMRSPRYDFWRRDFLRSKEALELQGLLSGILSTI
ncbi:Not1-domain-containing protein [Dacryopinax primogenitus]|uniref:Not1-domain-containing protein n=1 Tax=Dacryopinax primogenitus (strain DJM 731) TaxID=1858805 RepID=M5FT27_DACPD|nr:Not1-domain-containing protein [Dacryopinax primogenitus]EJT98519.1 Not1-domain-containing protein [Dacryopinax primogenitus]